MRYEVTDGGKPSNLYENNLDCTVRALAISASIPYELAYIIFEDSGRKPGRPCALVPGLEEFERQGFGRWENGNNAIDPTVNQAFAIHNKMTVAQFVRRYPTGRFIVRVACTHTRRTNHCFAIVDGIAYDNQKPSPRKRIQHSFKVLPKS